MKPMKNKFLQVSIGVCLILFAAGFFVRSFSAASATPTPEKFIEQGTGQIGKYQMTTTGSGDLSGGMNVLIWDTETGESVIYY
jgi:hypothetical protein